MSCFCLIILNHFIMISCSFWIFDLIHNSAQCLKIIRLKYGVFGGLCLQVVNPFYVFQIFSIILWCFDDYYIYAACILIISLISLGVELYETRKVRLIVNHCLLCVSVCLCLSVSLSVTVCLLASLNMPHIRLVQY